MTTIDKDGEFFKVKLNYQPSGGKTWLAKITGTHPKMKFERQFINADSSNISSSGKTGNLIWLLNEDGYYEYREAWNGQYFFKIENGELKTIDELEVVKIMKKYKKEF